MTASLDAFPSESVRTPSSSSSLQRLVLLLYFALTLFVSAFLLFLVQPLIGKMILPRLGGSPAVWNTCMVFFQATLLAGYGYSHFLSTRLRKKRQLIIHSLLLVAPLALVPFAIGDWRPSADTHPFLAVMGVLAVLVGAPFFVVSTTGPLLQKWFAETGHPSSKDPYFLYGASNLGSMLALVLYPLFIQPTWSIDVQSTLWAIGYGSLAVLTVGCAFLVWRGSENQAPVEHVTDNVLADSTETDRPITLWRRLRWIGLAAAPSSLMLGVTTYLTTDIAPVPLFWVIPLAMYLGTFILVFMRWPWQWVGNSHQIVLMVQPSLLLCLLLVRMYPSGWPTGMIFVIHLAAFFATALMCHGELAKDRPSTKFLTEFYFWLSLGGVLGGLFNALVAPTWFWIGPIEYWIAFALACFLRPRWLPKTPLVPNDHRQEKRFSALGFALDLAWPICIGLMMYGIFWYDFRWPYNGFWLAVPLGLWLLQMGRPVRLGLALVLIMTAVLIDERRYYNYLYETRTFFGFLGVRLREHEKTGVKYYLLMHGVINHGVQLADPKERRRPVAYFNPDSGVGQAFSTFSWPDARLPVSLIGLGTSPLGQLVATQSEPPVAVLGLGVGTLAAHARPYQHFRFFEIDPEVKRLSLPPDGEKCYFHYLQDAIDRGADLKVIIGDGRLSMLDSPDKYYHALVMDAFASDAIPVHLLTKEAFELYLQKLAPGGLLMINASNRYVDINPVVADLAEHFDLNCLQYGDHDKELGFGTDWMILQRNPKKWYGDGTSYNGGRPFEQRMDLRLGKADGWQIPNAPGHRLWTDDYSNLMGIMKGVVHLNW